MKVHLNEELVLTSLAILQPASATETVAFLIEAFPSLVGQVTDPTIESLFRKWSENQLILLVAKSPQQFSLTARGNERLSLKARRYRDKVRMFLLKSCRYSRLYQSGEVGQELAGVSPALDSRTITKESARPNGSAANSPAFRLRVVGRPIWPRLAKQLNLAGSDQTSPDSSYRYYSFSSLELLWRAAGTADISEGIGIREIAVALGISPHLISACIHAPANHYRHFTIPKKSGGERTISAPRVFLKVIQYWTLDYLLFNLRTHSSCHSYQQGRSILSNAIPHIGTRYVANVDIENFFGSITKNRIAQLLTKRNIPARTAHFIASISTLDGALPQGAPTSPQLSNAFLYEFDRQMSQLTIEHKLNYSRYADDITVSGEDLSKVRYVIGKIGPLLKVEGLVINESKTRVISQGGQQRVTGVIVNTMALPPRKLRRRVRAMFDQARKNPTAFRDRAHELRGYLGYLESFPDLSPRLNGTEYRRILAELEN
jgi:retron-type reverse transcriptase